MNTLLNFIAIFSLALGTIALFMLPRFYASTTYSACKISITVKDLELNIEITSDYKTTSTEKISAANWTAKLTKESIVKMVKLYPQSDILRLNVQVNKSKFYNE